jgi:uncharacterized membrane protein YbhN (UPF0104 family)
MENNESKLNGIAEVPRKSWKTVFWTVLRVGIGLALFASIMRMFKPEELLRAIQSVRLEYLGLAVILAYVNIGMQILKWFYIMKQAQPDSRLRTAATSFFLGVTFGIMTPGQLGEYGGRALAMPQGKRAYFLGLTVVDKIQMLFVLILGGLTGYTYFFSHQLHTTIFVFIVLLGILLYLNFHLNLLARLFTLIPKRFVKAYWIEAIHEALHAISFGKLTISFLLTLSVYLIIFAQTSVLLMAFSHVPFPDILFGYGAMMFTKAALPISFGDIGVREATSIYFYSLLGIPAVAAFTTSVIIFFTNIIVPSVVGIFFLPHRSSLHSLMPDSLKKTMRKPQ